LIGINNMENKQTPVEFLIENLKNVLTKSQFNDVVIQDIFEQAKTMDNKPKMIEDDVETVAETEYPIFDGGLLSIAYNQKHSRIDFIKGYNKAKKMEKEQILEFTRNAVRKILDEDRQNPFNLEQYYNETYDKKENK